MMRGNALKKLMGRELSAFLCYEIRHGDAKRRKTALQDLTQRYRQGFVLPPDELPTFEMLINGILLNSAQDLKVVRWCLNAFARFGRIETTKNYIETAMRLYEGNPEIEAAAIAALFRMHRGNYNDAIVLQKIDPVIWQLAALQTTDPKKLDLSNLRVDIDQADSETLKLALITVGTNRDIPEMFHPRFENGVLVGKLNQHDHPIVQQYSVWAIIENKKLSISDLSIKYDTIDAYPNNVQSKVYQLIGGSEPDLRKRFDMTNRGSVVSDAEVREGLAKGIKDTYYDGLEEVTLEWFDTETDSSVRGSLAEHFSKKASESPLYRQKSLEIYEIHTDLRSRILLGSEGSALYGELKTFRSGDLFESLETEGALTESITRQISMSIKENSVRVLLMSVCPDGDLRIDREFRDLKEKVNIIQNKKRNVMFEIAGAVRTDQIQDHLLNFNPNFIHFSGHGSLGKLYFEDEFGKSVPVSDDALVSVFEMLRGQVKCAVFNACYSDSINRKLKSYVKYLVGCDGEIDDRAAIIFSRSFYQAIASGKSIPDAFGWGVAGVRTGGFEREAQKYILA